MSEQTRSQINELYSPEHRKHRLERAPWIRDAFAWHREQKADMVMAACWYAQNSRLAGDFLEFGVWEGLTIIEAYHATRRLSVPMRLHAFDSFEGLPAPQGDEDIGARKGMFYLPREVFESNLQQAGVDLGCVSTTAGFFEQTLTAARAAELDLQRAAVVWIDCDLYSSTVPVLEFVAPLLVDGSVLVFDDWYAYAGRSDRGEQRACHEWLARHPELRISPYRQYHAHGQSFLVHRST